MLSIKEKARLGIPLKEEFLLDSHTHYGYFSQAYMPHDDPDEIAANMDRLGIDKACMCTAGCGMMGNNSLQNDRLLCCVKKRPDKFYGYATLNANEKDSIYEHLLKYEALGLDIGAKMHVNRQDYRITDDFLIPVLKHLNERHAIFLHHCLGTVADVEAVLRAYPEMTFIQGHPVSIYQDLVCKYDNFYMCTCASLAYRDIEDMVRKMGSEKIVYGSDLVALDSTFGFGPVLFADITDNEKRNILGLNMKKLIAKVKR